MTNEDIGVRHMYDLMQAFTSGYSNMKDWDKLSEDEKEAIRKRYNEYMDDLPPMDASKKLWAEYYKKKREER